MAKRLKGGVRQERENVASSSVDASTPRLKGGVRQEMEKVASSSSKGPFPADLDSEDPPGKKHKSEDQDYHEKVYKSHLTNIFVNNKLSGKDVQELSQYSSAAGAGGVSDYAGAGKKGDIPGNIHRDLKRKAKATSPMPDVYYAEVPVSQPDTHERSIVLLPILLLHEVLLWLIESSAIFVRDVNGTHFPDGSGRKQSFLQFCSSHGLDMLSIILLGIHGDGVPFAKMQSVQVLSWNMLIGSGERILFALVEKAWQCRCGCGGRCTLDALLTVFKWSLECLFIGNRPSKRRDSSDWTPHDKKNGRHTKNGEAFGFGARLQEERGDWAWRKELFHFAGWASHSICWICKATQPSGLFPFTDFSAKAKWRSTIHSMGSFFKTMKDNGILPSPLFSVPGFQWQFIMIDCLHTMDLGVTQVTLGNLFYEYWYSPMCKASNQALKTLELWKLIKEYYKRIKPASAISALTVEMVKQPKKGPKFRGKGAETRHLVLFGYELAQAMAKSAGGTDRHYNQLEALMFHLFTFYSTFGKSPYDVDLAKKSVHNFCQIYADFNKSARDEKFWSIKPKFHLMIHLADKQVFESGDPSKFWAYCDEDFVGLIGKIAVARGGRRLANTTPQNVMDKYRALA